MKATIKEIVKTEPEAWQGLTKTTFYANEHAQQAYMFSKPGNVPTVGDVLEGEFSQDRAANWKFKRAQAASGQGGSYRPSAPQERTFKADPVKQESIEWQACLKAAVEAVRDYYTISGAEVPKLPDYKLDIVNALVTFTQTIERKPDHSIALPQPDEDTVEDSGDFAKVNPVDDDQPPIEAYDDVPTEEDDINLADIPF